MIIGTLTNVVEPSSNSDGILPIIVSIIALVVSIISIFVDKKKTTLEIITQNRIEWIKEVRNLLKEFIEVYTKNGDNEQFLIIKNKISLYVRDGVTSYKELIEQLNHCVANGYNQKDCNKLIQKAQNVLSEVWIRMKREAGISKKEDNRYSKMFESKYK